MDLNEEDLNSFRREDFDLEQWEKELDAHPAFMKTISATSLSPAMEALQAMKYEDPDDTAEHKARVHKDDGNRFFKAGKYRQSIESYTEAIGQRCSDRAINAVLYANRSAANLRLGNKRSALKDCVFARKLDPTHTKAIRRGAQLLLDLGKPTEAMQWCRDSMINLAELSEQDREETIAFLHDIELKAESAEKIKNRDIRKENALRERTKRAEQELLNALRDRAVKYWYPEEADAVQMGDIAVLDVQIPPSVLEVQENARVSLGPERELRWPVLFVYPEFKQTDFVREFDERVSFETMLEEMFGEESPPMWDEERCYTWKNLEVWFESFTREDELVRVPRSATLRRALSDDRYRIKHGLPTFIVVSKASGFYGEYIKKHIVKEMNT